MQRHLALLAEPIRVRLMALLAAEELSVGELVRVLQLPQSTVSRHLKALREAGWIRRRADGASGWFRAEEAPPSPELWALVQQDHATGSLWAEDQERLAAILVERATDSHTFFGQMHAQWDALRTQLFGESFIMPALLALLPPESVVAELGCGTGPNLVDLAPNAAKVIGIDREQRMLDAAERRTQGLDNIDLRLGGLEDLPLAQGEIDLALCVLVLHHIQDLEQAFSEMARALRPQGRVAITDMRRHDRTAYRDTMGHAHLGFDPQDLQRALPANLELLRYTPLRPDPEMQGPPLFTAVVRRC